MSWYRSEDSLPSSYGYYRSDFGVSNEKLYFVLSTRSAANHKGHWDIEYQLISENGLIEWWFQSSMSRHFRQIKMVGQ